MARDAVTQGIEAIIENFFRQRTGDGEGSDDTKPVTYWLPKLYKDKYAQLQRNSNNEFSDLCKEVLKYTIDYVLEREKSAKSGRAEESRVQLNAL